MKIIFYSTILLIAAGCALVPMSVFLASKSNHVKESEKLEKEEGMKPAPPKIRAMP